MSLASRLAQRLVGSSARVAMVLDSLARRRRRRAVVLAVLGVVAMAGIARARWTTNEYVEIWFDPDGGAFETRSTSMAVTFCNLTGVGEIGLLPIDEETIRIGWVHPGQSGQAEIIVDLTNQFTIEPGETTAECGQVFEATTTNLSYPSGATWTLYAEAEVALGESNVLEWGYSEDFVKAPDPVIDTAALRIGMSLQRSACAANCFDGTASYTTPAYFSLDQPRTLTLFYSSHQAQTRHTVALSLVDTTYLPIVGVSIRLKRPDQSYVTFMNDSTEMVFEGEDGHFLHGLQFEEDLATGAYEYLAEVTSSWVYQGDTVTATDSTPVRILVVNERTSPYGVGWSIPGLQRVRTLSSGSSVVVTGGDGSIVYFQWTGSGYTSPAGDFSTLLYRAAPDTIRYERRYPDSTRAYFRALDGQLSYVDDKFGNRTAYQYNGSKLTTVTDPVGKTITLGYTSNKLSSITDRPGNRTTTITMNGNGEITQIQDPAGGKPLQSLTYDAEHRLTSRTDRRGNTWKQTYDYAGKLATDSTPSVTAGGVTGRL